MAVHPRQQHRPVGHHPVEVGGGREAAEVPALLVPAAAGDPRGVGMRGGVAAERVLRRAQAVRVRQVEAQRLEAQFRHVAVRVEQAGQQHAAVPVEPPVRPPGPRLVGVEQLRHPALSVDQQAGEPLQRAVRVHRVAGDIVDQPLLGRRHLGHGLRPAAGVGGGGEQQDEREQAGLHGRRHRWRPAATPAGGVQKPGGRE